MALIGVCVFAATGAPGTQAYFSDSELSAGNAFRTGYWTTPTATPTAPSGHLGAYVYIMPRSLEKRSQGNPVTAIIELAAGYDVAKIDTGSIRLCLGTSPCGKKDVPTTGKATLGDANGNGIPDLKVTFDRGAVLALVADVAPPTSVTFAVSGSLTAPKRAFAGSDTLRIVDPIVAPNATATPTSNATPTETASPRPTATATPVATATGSPATPTATPPAGATPGSTATATEMPTGAPTTVPTAAPTPTPTYKPLPTATASPPATATPTSRSSPSPTPPATATRVPPPATPTTTAPPTATATAH